MIGDNIRGLRKRKNIKLNMLAKIANINASYLSEIERGMKTNPSIDVIGRIAIALDVSIIDLIAGDSTAENKYFDELNNMVAPDAPESNKKAFSAEIDNHALVKPKAPSSQLKSDLKKFYNDSKISSTEKEELFKYVTELFWNSRK